MKRVGRNDPCPCGSGKKFKKCHFGREDELVFTGMSEVPEEMSERITRLPEVHYGRSQEFMNGLDIQEITGKAVGIKCIDLKQYRDLDLTGSVRNAEGTEASGGLLVNPLKTQERDPHHIYLAISPTIGESTLIHQIAHVLDYLVGSRQMPGLATPLAYDMGIPVEHLEHPHEFGYWLDHLSKKLNVPLDAEDTIITYLYGNDMLLRSEHIQRQDPMVLRAKSERIMEFLSQKSPEVDALICELPGYIGSRVKED